MSVISIDADVDTFIDAEFNKLAAYNAQRPAGHPYAFDTHSQRVAYDMRDLALRMNYTSAQANVLYRLTLVHDIGKRSFPVAIWDMKDKPSEEVKSQRRAHTTAGVDIVDAYFGAADNRPVLKMMRDLMQNHHECMDGSGWLKIPGDKLSQEVRMLAACDSFDGMSERRPHYENRDLSPSGVIERMTGEKAGQFDPQIMAIFAEMKKNQTPIAASTRKPKALNAVL